MTPRKIENVSRAYIRAVRLRLPPALCRNSQLKQTPLGKPIPYKGGISSFRSLDSPAERGKVHTNTGPLPSEPTVEEGRRKYCPDPNRRGRDPFASTDPLPAASINAQQASLSLEIRRGLGGVEHTDWTTSSDNRESWAESSADWTRALTTAGLGGVEQTKWPASLGCAPPDYSIINRQLVVAAYVHLRKDVGAILSRTHLAK